MPAERLQKLLAQAGVASRRGAEELIAAGRVAVNGRVATIGESADAGVDVVTLDGRPVGPAERRLHYAVHKPAGYLSSSRDERGRRSVVRLLRGVPEARQTRLWPAGRLDADSEGLLVLTNDGAWANRFLHPRYGVEREYAVLAHRDPHPDEVVALLDGVQLSDGPARFIAVRVDSPPAEVARERDERGTWLRVRVGEGRKREVRRLLAAAGLRVHRLVRVRFGTLTLAGLPSGAWRALKPEEIAGLTGSEPSPPAAPRPPRARLCVAIDGPSGSGKSTVGYALAQRIGANFVDTGLMYRALTLAALERGVDVNDADALGRLAREAQIQVRRPLPGETDRRETVLLDGVDVTKAARTPRVDRAVSAVSRHAAVRGEMLLVQRAVALEDDTVMVGRDIGTVVMPDATLKVFLVASPEVRAARRAAQMGRPDRIERYLAEIQERDAADSGRDVAPLRQAPEALVLDTGELGVEACVEAVVARLPAGASVRDASVHG
jgi:23S rRNA pseudouridine2605 synthase